MSQQVIDEFKIVGLQNFNLDEKLNLIDITIKDSAIQEKLTKYSNWHYKYRFINDSNINQFISCPRYKRKFLVFNRLADARTSLINGKIYQSLEVINVGEIKDWSKLKGESK